MIQCSGYTKKRIIRHSLRLCNSNSEVAEWDNKGSSDRRINNKKCRKNLEEVKQSVTSIVFSVSSCRRGYITIVCYYPNRLNNAHKGRPCGG